MSRSLQWRRYRLPFRTPVRTAHGFWPVREGIIVRIESEVGHMGWGEAAPIPHFGKEEIEGVVAACQTLGDRVELPAIFGLPEHLGSLRGALRSAWRESDGPTPDSGGRVLPYLPVAALLPAGRAVLEAIGPKAEIGFRIFKWKVGVGDWQDELALLDDLCAALPPGAELRLDANGAWDRIRAERWLERCADRPVEFVEQPVAANAKGSEDLLLGLANDFPTQLALDESLVGSGDIEHWLGLDWKGVFVVKPLLLGDPAVLERLASEKAAVVFSSALETAIGARTALKAAFSWEGPARALGFGVWPLFSDSAFDGPIATPFFRREDVERLNPENLWTALS